MDLQHLAGDDRSEEIAVKLLDHDGHCDDDQGGGGPRNGRRDERGEDTGDMAGMGFLIALWVTATSFVMVQAEQRPSGSARGE